MIDEEWIDDVFLISVGRLHVCLNHRQLLNAGMKEYKIEIPRYTEKFSFFKSSKW